MPDYSIDFKLADRMLSEVETNFALLDANKDKRLAENELRGGTFSDRNGSDYHFREATSKFVLDYLSTFGHKEKEVLNVKDVGGGAVRMVREFTDDPKAIGESYWVLSKDDISKARKQLQTVGAFSGVQPKPDANDFLKIANSKFDVIDKDRDGTVTIEELESRAKVLPRSKPVYYLDSMAYNYVIDRMKNEPVPERKLETRIQTAAGYYENGTTSYTTIMAGKVVMLLPRVNPGRYVEPTYETRTSFQKFIQKSDLNRWKAERK